MKTELVKELAKAVVENERTVDPSGVDYCTYCGGFEKSPDWKLDHQPNCIFLRAKKYLDEAGE